MSTNFTEVFPTYVALETELNEVKLLLDNEIKVQIVRNRELDKLLLQHLATFTHAGMTQFAKELAKLRIISTQYIGYLQSTSNLTSKMNAPLLHVEYSKNKDS